MNRKKLIVIIMVAAIMIIGIVAASAAFISPFIFDVFDREGIAFNSGTFTTSGGTGFTFGVTPGEKGGISNVSNNTWKVSPSSANGSSRIDYTFTTANLEAMTVTSTNSEGNISLTFTQGDTERIFDIAGEFHENIDMSGFESGRIRLRLVFDNAKDVNTVVSW
ncbi:MAG: hypothetical protein LBD23_05695 [Oscillospiraceae bacterium]|jgi:hypothetical protein|nr:hypothetical protein [Oscillospiraceae bacterium]